MITAGTPSRDGAGGGGAIVTTSSISALRPRGLTGYSAVKGAVIALTRAMAVDHGPQGIRVNCIVPGPLYTPMAIADGMTERKRESRRLSSVLEIEGTGWDVAYAAVYLASDEARYVTGANCPSTAACHCGRRPVADMARVPYLDADDLDDADRALLAGRSTWSVPWRTTRAACGSSSGSGSGSAPRAARRAAARAGHPPRRVRDRCAYEYSHHVRIGQEFGVTADDIKLVRGQAGAPEGDEGAAVVIEAATEITTDLGLADETWQRPSAWWAPRCAVELVLVVAHYCAVVRVLNSLKVDVEPEYERYLREFPLEDEP